MLPKGSRNVVPVRPAFPLENYIEPGRGGVDLSKHKAGQAGFKKCVEDFVAAYPYYDRGNLELSEKVVLVGDPCVGKTCLVLRFIDDCYANEYQSTIGVDFYWQKYTCNKFEFTLHIWDTAGQERFRALSKAYYRGAEACIVSFDLGLPETLVHAKQWVVEVKKGNPNNQDLCVFLAGCKSDMFHTVSATHAERVASELGAEYFEVSAKSGHNIRTLFDRVAIVMFERSISRAAAEFKAEAAKAESRLKATGQSTESEKVVLIGGGKGLGDPGAGKGTENWKEVKKKPKSSSKSHCCGSG